MKVSLAQINKIKVDFNEIFLEQLWKINGTKLVNRAHVWNSNAIWCFKQIEDNAFYIENTSENKVLSVIDDNVELVQNGAGELWEKGETNKEGYFTLTQSSSEKALTAISTDCLVIKGKIMLKFFLKFDFLLM